MLEENHSYGHAQILLRYAGIPFPVPIPARIQHGWQPGLGFGFQLEALDKFAQPWPNLVWNRRNLEQCNALGFDRVIAIGAPFLYMPPARPTQVLGERSLLALPLHGWENERVYGNPADYADSLASLIELGFGPVTVCLYHLEYEDPTIRGIFEGRGFRVVTNGPRFGNPQFLFEQRRTLMSHRYATSNVMGSAGFYALATGCRFFLHGPPMGLGRGWDPSGEEHARWQAAEFPQLAYERFNDECHKDVALRELGYEFVRTPNQLRTLLLQTLILNRPGMWLRQLVRVGMRRLERKLEPPDGHRMSRAADALIGLTAHEADYIQMRRSLSHSLRRYREEHQLSYAEMGAILHLSARQIEDMELDRATVSLDLLVRSHLILGKSLAQLAEIIAAAN